VCVRARASGHVATEDVVYAFERMGMATGIHLESVIRASERVASVPGAETGGHVGSALGQALRSGKVTRAALPPAASAYDNQATQQGS
jgi:hypothetical protein